MIVPLIALVAQFNGQDIRRFIAAGEKDAYLMMPPETICGSESSEFLWTGDGNSLVVRRTVTEITASQYAALVTKVATAPPLVHTDLLVWDGKARSARKLLSYSTSSYIGKLSAMAGTDRILYQASEHLPGVNGGPERVFDGITMIATKTGAATRITLQNPDHPTYDALWMSPTRPLGAVRSTVPNGPTTIRFFGPDGKLGPAGPIPTTEIFFDAQGLPGIIASTGKDRKGPVGFHRIDPATARIVAEIPFPPPTRDKAGNLVASPQADTFLGRRPTDDSLVTQTLQVGNPSAPTVLLMVKGGKQDESGVVSTDGTMPVLSPRLDAVAYLSQGSVMVRGLAKVPRVVLDDARRAAERTLTLSKAKQAGLALIMFAGDNDDVYPGQDVDIRQKIGPYVKNMSILDGFNYTYGGGSLTDIEKPAETEIGFTPGPGGRAVVYADGHVKWKADGS